MTTSRSPLHVLREQARTTAANLKRAAEGVPVAPDPAGKIKSSLARGTIKFAVVMDDKVIKFEMEWKTIREMSAVELGDVILEQMKKSV